LPEQVARDDVVHQVRCRLGHAPGPARRAKASAFAAERNQLVFPAVTAAQPQEAVGQGAALQEGVELVLHKLPQVGSGCGLKPARRRWRRAAAQQRYSVVCSGRWRRRAPWAQQDASLGDQAGWRQPVCDEAPFAGDEPQPQGATAIEPGAQKALKQAA